MSSAVYYKFKSQKEPSKVLFDGTGISIFDLKKEILLANKLSDTADSFDLIISNPDTKEEYKDDTEIISRSMSVTARRLPASRPGKGTAIRYVSGSMPVMGGGRNDLKRTQKVGGTDSVAPAVTTPIPTGNEEDMISAMFQAQGQQWEQTQEHMANATPIYYKPNHQPHVPDHPPPPGYVCYRCGQKGHWIQACPTNNDPTWEGKRVRRTTGIPKSFLKTVAKPADEDSGTYMINGEGEFVVAVADESSWKNFQDKAKASKDQTGKPDDPELEDPISHRLFSKPVKTPCCNTTYSEEGIQQSLLDNDFICPKCGADEILLDSLKPDTEMEERVKKYREEKGLDSPKAEKAELSSDNGKRKRDSEDESEATGNEAKKLKEGDDKSESPESVDGEISTKDGLNSTMPPLMPGVMSMPPMIPGMPMPPMIPGMPMPPMPMMPGMPFMPNMPNMPNMPPMSNMPPMPNMGMPPFMMGPNNGFNNGGPGNNNTNNGPGNFNNNGPGNFNNNNFNRNNGNRYQSNRGGYNNNKRYQNRNNNYNNNNNNNNSNNN